MKKLYMLLAPLFAFILFTAEKTYAVCPVCVVAVGVGVGVFREMGVDDTITGIWIGALTVGMILWTLDFMHKRKWRFKFDQPIWVIVYYGMVIGSLYYLKMVGSPLNTLWGFDKLLLGTAIGSVFFLIGAVSYDIFKAKRGKPFFPFQKVVQPLVPLLILSAVFYYITK